MFSFIHSTQGISNIVIKYSFWQLVKVGTA